MHWFIAEVVINAAGPHVADVGDAVSLDHFFVHFGEGFRIHEFFVLIHGIEFVMHGKDLVFGNHVGKSADKLRINISGTQGQALDQGQGSSQLAGRVHFNRPVGKLFFHRFFKSQGAELENRCR